MTDGPGGLGFTMGQPQPEPTKSDFANRVATAAPEEFRAEVERRKPLGPVTSQTLDDAAATVMLKSLPQLSAQFDVSRGHAADVSRFDPKYLRALEDKGISHSEILEVAQRMRPDLSKTEALKWWTSKANKMRGDDLRMGSDFDSRTGTYDVVESDD